MKTDNKYNTQQLGKTVSSTGHLLTYITIDRLRLCLCPYPTISYFLTEKKSNSSIQIETAHPYMYLFQNLKFWSILSVMLRFIISILECTSYARSSIRLRHKLLREQGDGWNLTELFAKHCTVFLASPAF